MVSSKYFPNCRDIEADMRADELEAQRLELMKEREVFQQEQQERERRWHKEKEQLQEAQKRLDEVNYNFLSIGYVS